MLHKKDYKLIHFRRFILISFHFIYFIVKPQKTCTKSDNKFPLPGVNSIRMFLVVNKYIDNGYLGYRDNRPVIGERSPLARWSDLITCEEYLNEEIIIKSDLDI